LSTNLYLLFQARALSFSVIAYASNIENLGALGDAVELISEKHVSLHIQPEHYLVVGEYLLKAIKEVLGDVATDPILDEWKKAVFFLAGIFIDVEKKKYDTQLALEGIAGKAMSKLFPIF
jgi:nitric oxide dioxygenase